MLVMISRSLSTKDNAARPEENWLGEMLNGPAGLLSCGCCVAGIRYDRYRIIFFIADLVCSIDYQGLIIAKLIQQIAPILWVLTSLSCCFVVAKPGPDHENTRK